jgi:hypothetical protein
MRRVDPGLQVAGADARGGVHQLRQRSADPAVEQVGQIQGAQNQEEGKASGAGVEIAKGRRLALPERRQIALACSQEFVQRRLEGQSVRHHLVRELGRLGLVAPREETEGLVGGHLEPLLLFLDRLELEPLLGRSGRNR